MNITGHSWEFAPGEAELRRQYKEAFARFRDASIREGALASELWRKLCRVVLEREFPKVPFKEAAVVFTAKNGLDTDSIAGLGLRLEAAGITIEKIEFDPAQSEFRVFGRKQ